MDSVVHWGRYEELRPDQIDAIRKQTPVAYVPWGALEWHGRHNPVGLDGLKAHGICVATARETGGVVLPTVFVGTDTIKPFKGFKHTLEHRRETVAALCEEYLSQLEDEGFRVLVVLTGHYGVGHVETLRAAARRFAAARPRLRVWMLDDSEPHQGHFPPNHAAKGETSYMMHLLPHTVDLSLLPADRQATLDDDGIWGEDARESSALFGRAELELIVRVMAAKIRQLLAEIA